ncbi:hypothetical protein D3C77_537770 [compost metagenome]
MNNYAFFIEIISKRFRYRAFLLQFMNHRGFKFAAASHLHGIPDAVYNNSRLANRTHDILDIMIVHQRLICFFTEQIRYMQQAVSRPNPFCHTGSNRIRLNFQALSEPSTRWYKPVLLERGIRRRI